MSRYITKGVYLEKPKRQIIWDGGSSKQCRYGFLKSQGSSATENISGMHSRSDII
jgi:hypothetical protein